MYTENAPAGSVRPGRLVPGAWLLMPGAGRLVPGAGRSGGPQFQELFWF